MFNLVKDSAPETTRRLLDFFAPNGGLLADVSAGKRSLVQTIDRSKWEISFSDLLPIPTTDARTFKKNSPYLHLEDDETVQAKWDALPYKDETFDALLYDPPYKFDGKASLSLPVFDDGEFDGWDVQHSTGATKDHCPQLREFFRVLKPGGILISKVMNTRNKSVFMDLDMFVRIAAQLAGFATRDVVVYDNNLAQNYGYGGRTLHQSYGFFLIFERPNSAEKGEKK